MNSNENNIDQAVDILLCMIEDLAQYNTGVKSILHICSTVSI